MTSLCTSEHQEAVLLADWASVEAFSDPRLNLFFAIPNGGDRNPRVGQKLKDEGVKRGVPYYFLAVPCNCFHGLFIELKANKGRASPEQKQWIHNLNEQGYQAVIAHGADQAILTIENYLKK